jgi:hypothetical protein
MSDGQLCAVNGRRCAWAMRAFRPLHSLTSLRAGYYSLILPLRHIFVIRPLGDSGGADWKQQTIRERTKVVLRCLAISAKTHIPPVRDALY